MQMMMGWIISFEPHLPQYFCRLDLSSLHFGQKLILISISFTIFTSFSLNDYLSPDAPANHYSKTKQDDPGKKKPFRFTFPNYLLLFHFTSLFLLRRWYSA